MRNKLIAGVCIVFFMGCATQKEKKGINLTGKLLGRGFSTQSALQPLQNSTEVPLENYILYCVSFETYPVAASGIADSSGYFEIKDFDVAGKPFGCFVLDESGEHVADIIFKTSGSSLSGENQLSGTVVLTSDADLGTIVVDLNTHVAYVEMSEVEGEKGEVSEPFNFTGEWLVECVYEPGYDDPSAIGEEGPCVEGGVPFYIFEFSATDRDTGKKRYGIQVWKNKESFEACGGVIGITQEEIDSDPEAPNVEIDDPSILGHFQYAKEPPGSDSWEYLAGITCTESTTWPNDWNQDGDTTDTCASLTGADQLYCYANCFYADVVEDNPNLCVEDRDYNWSMTPQEVNTNPQDFIMGRHRPTNAVNEVVEFFYENNDVGSATFIDEWVSYPGYWDENTHMWVNKECRMVEVIQIILTHITDTEASGDLTIIRALDDSPDYVWCKENIGTELYPWDQEGKFHLKLKLTKIGE